MLASRSRVHGKWNTMSVSKNHELRILAPLGLSSFKFTFFGPTKVTSIKHSERALPPVSSKCRVKLSRICRITRDSSQLVKRLKQVHPGNRSCRSVQATPACNTQRMPLSAAKSICNFSQPRLPSPLFLARISCSRINDCSLVSSSIAAWQKD